MLNWHPLFAMAGLGEAADALACMIAVVWLAATSIVAVVAIVYRSTGWAVVSLLLLLLFTALGSPWTGFLPLPVMAASDPDTEHWHGVARVMAWLWAAACVVVLGGLFATCKRILFAGRLARS